MEFYKNRRGNSNVDSFEITEDGIIVIFRGGAGYLYTNQSAGSSNIARMHDLARRGHGLNSFINHKVKSKYAKKWKALIPPAQLFLLAPLFLEAQAMVGSRKYAVSLSGS
jgi:hypothetical protein